jgi:catechol 2,3-dioxygenase-like lactoylglutathione lyase family enzyme
MKPCLYHVQINVGDAAVSIPFYRALFGYFEYTTIVEANDMLGVSNGTTDFWMVATPRDRQGARFHRKNPGLNHLCFGVRVRADVDRFVAEFMTPHSLAALYNSPREYPEYRPGYYAVFFEDPDRLKIEVAHVPGITDRR